MGERLQERRRKINQNISWKGGMVPEQHFFRLPQCCTKFETRKEISMIAILEVEVTTNITHINPQQTNPLKMTKKNGLH